MSDDLQEQAVAEDATTEEAVQYVDTLDPNTVDFKKDIVLPLEEKLVIEGKNGRREFAELHFNFGRLNGGRMRAIYQSVARENARKRIPPYGETPELSKDVQLEVAAAACEINVNELDRLSAADWTTATNLALIFLGVTRTRGRG